MYAHLVLYAAHVHTAVTLVVDEHGQTATIACAGLASCQDKVYVAVAVGDETLRAVQTPATVLLVVGGLEHYALQVAAGIRFGKVHGHGLAGTHTGDVFLALLLRTEAIEGLYAVLQGPDVLETGICRCHHLVGGGIDSNGQVQTTIAAGHGHTVQSCLVHGLQVLVCL